LGKESVCVVVEGMRQSHGDGSVVQEDGNVVRGGGGVRKMWD